MDKVGLSMINVLELDFGEAGGWVVAMTLTNRSVGISENGQWPSQRQEHLERKATIMKSTSPKRGFTLIELLVVIAIIAILAAIMFPVFATARENARKASCLSNLKQLGLAVQMYANDWEAYPMSSSPSSTVPRTRWADYIFPYVKSEAMFTCPSERDTAILSKAFAHNASIKYGGYGYNYQYLGNSRVASPNLPFAATDSMIERPAETVAIADSNGVPSIPGEGVYVVDPPIGSSRGSGDSSGFYKGRSMPAERHTDMVNVVFADGHAKSMRMSRLDDSNGDGLADNGYWNGRGDHSRW